MTDTPTDPMDSQTDIDNIQNIPANSDASNGSPRPQATKSDSEHMDEWLGDVLVEVNNDYGITCEIKVEEYLDITTTRSDDENCWLHSNSIDLALALLTQREGRKDVCTLTIQHGIDLFRVGWGTSKMEDLLNDPFIGPALKDVKRRFIVVPVNDGPIHFVREQADKDEKTLAKQKIAKISEKESAKEVKKSADVIKQRTYSTHWGLLVIDKEKRKARWIDSSLALTNNRKYPDRKRIVTMSQAAIAAGKILCAIEQVLGSARGTFDAKTAKYVPQQIDDNRFKDDPGASCGPYMFAFLQYLYKHPEYMNELHKAFGVRKWRKHCNEMDFDSLYTRVAMQKIIQDKSEEKHQAGELSLKMTSDVFRILQPRVLAPWVATAYRSYHGSKPDDVEGLFDRFDFRKYGLGPDSGGKRSGGSGASHPPGHRKPGPPPRGPKGKEVYDTDEEDVFGDDFIYDMHNPENIPISKRYLRQVIREQPGDYVGCRTKEDAYRFAYEMVRDEHIEVESTRLAEHAAANNTSAAKSPPRRSCLPILQFPDTIPDMPADFADPHEVPSKQLKLWRKHNLEKIKECGLGPKAMEDGVSVRAVLQVLSGVKFIDESEHRLTTIWIKDPEVFTDKERKDGEQPSASEIAERMKLKYEIFGMDKKTATKRSHDGDIKTGVNKKAKMGTLSDFSMIGEETPDFTHMTSDEVQEWIKLLPAATAAPMSSMGTWSQKAVLQNLFGNFDDLSSADKSLWLKHHLVLKINKAGMDDVGRILKESVKDVPFSRVKGVIIFYPQSYQDKFAERHSVNPDTPEPDVQMGEGSSDDYFVLESDNEEEPQQNTSTAPPPKKSKAVIGHSDYSWRQTKNANNDTNALTKKKLPPPHFLTMEESELHHWLAELPSDLKAPLYSEGKLVREAHARIYLERIFNKTFQTWAAEHTLSNDTQRQIKRWKRLGTFPGSYAQSHEAGLRKFLDEQLFPQTKKKVGGKGGRNAETVPVIFPDYTENEDKWPDYWKEKTG